MFITTALAIVIVIALGVFAYTNLIDPNDNTNNDTKEDESDDSSDDNTESDSIDEEIVLTIIHQGTNYTYTLSDLESLETYTGTGRYIKTRLLPDSVVLGTIYNYTGIRITSLLEDVNVSFEEYQLTINASDGWTTTYSMNETQGNVDVYNETGSIVENKAAVMIVAYKEDGEYYSEIDPENEIGPLRIAFVGDDTPITSSGLWAKSIVTITLENLA
jgi:hypothetical protein